MDIKEYDPRIRREVDPILLDALNALSKISSTRHAQYILEAFPALAKEYYPEMFLDKESSD